MRDQGFDPRVVIDAGAAHGDWTVSVGGFCPATIAPVDDCAGPEIECRRSFLRLDCAGELIETLGEAERAPGRVRVDERLDIRTGHNGYAFAKALGWDRPR
jgi:hypothetical protein